MGRFRRTIFRIVRHLIVLTILALILPNRLFPVAGVVHLVTIDGTINPATADFIHSQIDRATRAHAECLIIRLNTPGGLLKSTRVIISDFLSSDIPIVVYVSPGGAQAASAGVFITLAAHIAIMAPGTNIGAAHPVTTDGKEDSIMTAKMTNDAAAFIRSISEKRNRNVAWAENAVRSSVSLTESEAVKEHVVDTVAASVQEILTIIDGKEIELAHGRVRVQTANATIVTIDRTSVETLLDLVSDPNIAYIFMMLGIYGLLFELYSPGLIFPGIVGVVSLILAFYSLHTLPINYAGLALIVFSMILFILDLKIASHGMLTGGGIISLLIGSMMLIRTESAFDILTLSWKVVAVSVGFSAIFFIFIIGLGLRAQRRKPTTGIPGLLGESGQAVTTLDPLGRVRIHGELWSAQSLEGRIEEGSIVKAERIENLTLHVRKV